MARAHPAHFENDAPTIRIFLNGGDTIRPFRVGNGSFGGLLRRFKESWGGGDVSHVYYLPRNSPNARSAISHIVVKFLRFLSDHYIVKIF